MRRVVVFGTTGSGKSWLAERLAAQTGLRVIELDALFWGKDWQPAPLELFRHRVERETRDDGWIVVGNYGQVRDLVWRAADTLIWLDLPLPAGDVAPVAPDGAARGDQGGSVGHRQPREFRECVPQPPVDPAVGDEDPSQATASASPSNASSWARTRRVVRLQNTREVERFLTGQ